MSDLIRLQARSVEKVWGRMELPHPFKREGADPVGEIWFEPDPASPDLLAKYLFTSEKLSVQVHPRDGEAGRGVAGKDECWLVLDAEPGAALAIGFKEVCSPDEVRAAALDGTIEDLLEWHEVEAGDFFYLPAGTVHAIGAGISLVEVQQNTDITYRLYDYGRPRDLHLDEAMAVADLAPYPRDLKQVVDGSTCSLLVEGPYFHLAQFAGSPPRELLRVFDGPCQIVPLDVVVIAQGEAIDAGHSALVANLADVDFPGNARCLVFCSCA